MKTLVLKIVEIVSKIGTMLISWEKPESEMSVDEFIANHHLKNFPNQKSCALPKIKQTEKSDDDFEDSDFLVLV
ncbi:hypothetical protein [Flavobacterium sp.]|uniref:hypothetical protein n=1 Tax=Flavobacterium sp. TaxID=239 RepID=UPI0025BEBE69|nr:hypothetical protein [Flavobacterium sp.]MBA4155038.1 hypothetical protein [Flavobacterium sp.]